MRRPSIRRPLFTLTRDNGHKFWHGQINLAKALTTKTIVAAGLSQDPETAACHRADVQEIPGVSEGHRSGRPGAKLIAYGASSIRTSR